jgi:hypothetical protein
VPLSKQEVQYILSRITKSYYQQLQKLKVKNIPQVGSIALFSPAQDLIPGSAGTPTEKVTDAVKRLQPKLKSLLAAGIVKLTLNTTSSQLAVSAAMQKVDGSEIVAESFTVRGGANKTILRLSLDAKDRVNIGISINNFLAQVERVGFHRHQLSVELLSFIVLH